MIVRIQFSWMRTTDKHKQNYDITYTMIMTDDNNWDNCNHSFDISDNNNVNDNDNSKQ